jgi:hypothetical protein
LNFAERIVQELKPQSWRSLALATASALCRAITRSHLKLPALRWEATQKLSWIYFEVFCRHEVSLLPIHG